MLCSYFDAQSYQVVPPLDRPMMIQVQYIYWTASAWIHTIHKLVLLLCILLHLPKSVYLSEFSDDNDPRHLIGIGARPSPALGLPQLRVARAERLRCRCSKKAFSALAPVIAKGAPLLDEASARTATVAPLMASALALANERMSIEGTWLRNALLGWILLLAFSLVLSFYIVYSSTLEGFDDNDQSGAGGITL